MTRRRTLDAARVLFVVVALGCAWWGFHGRWSEVADGIAGTGPLRVGLSVLPTAGGLVLTAVLWRRLLGWTGVDVPPRAAASVFLVGQLGKYVPGSVWSVAAQAQLGRRHGIPPRASVAASSVFLLVHTATGLLLGGMLLLVVGAGPVPVPLLALAVVVGAVPLAPPLLRRVAGRLSGRETRLGWRELGTACALMAGTWAAYGLALALLLPGATADAPDLVLATAAFALAHAVGVLVVVAPAGLGAREGVLVALLAPSLGVPGAAAVALVSRFVHALADVAVAGLAAGSSRGLAAGRGATGGGVTGGAVRGRAGERAA